MLPDKKYLSANHWLNSPIFCRLLSLLLAVVMIPTPFAVYINPVDKGPTWLGLDASATMALNYALTEGWNWGHDIVYTYGPLAFLSTGIGFGIPAALFFVFASFLVFNFYRLFYDFITGNTHRLAAAILVVLLSLTMPLYFGSGLIWVLMIFLIYWMERYYQTGEWIALLMLPLLCSITFYLKLNAGLFIVVFLLIFLMLLLVERKIPRAHLAFTLGLLCLLILCGAWVFHVSIPAYIKGAVEVVKGYNDLMYLYQIHPGTTNPILWISFTLSALLLAASFLLLRRKRYAAAFLLLTGIAYLFLLKKQSLFRNDLQHIQEFFSFAPPASGLRIQPAHSVWTVENDPCSKRLFNTCLFRSNLCRSPAYVFAL